MKAEIDDDREEKLKYICERFLFEHQEMENFMTGFGKRKLCQCAACKYIREIYGDDIDFAKGE
jgi:hypothetical protein